MGLFDRIKTWFRRKSPKSPTSPASLSSTTSHPNQVSSSSEISQPISEGDFLIREHEQLETERTRLRQEITVVDSQYSSGEIEAGDRDRAYRMRLARAGQISMRQLEIRSKLVEIGHPIPDEWGAIQVLR